MAAVLASAVTFHSQLKCESGGYGATSRPSLMGIILLNSKRAASCPHSPPPTGMFPPRRLCPSHLPWCLQGESVNIHLHYAPLTKVRADR